jgi:hypothetical protein
VINVPRSACDSDKSLVLLWAGFFAAPVAWIINQGVAYAVMKPVCAAAATPVLVAIGVASLIVVIAGAWIGAGCTRSLRTSASDDGTGALNRNFFIAILTVAFNALVGLMILTSMIPQLFLSPCE